MNATLFNLEDIPASDPVTKNTPQTAQFYLRVKAGDGWHFLWQTHTNGGAEWAHDFELVTNGGKKKPLRYKTYNGAKRAAQSYLYSDAVYDIAVWKEVVK